MNEIIEEKLSLLAHVPGVYIMKDKDGTIIYVGKAISLKNRVTQYFRSHKNHSVKVKAMVARIVDFDVIIVGSEIEALILECNLIKKYRPKYNISLKDDKTYPYLKVSLNEDFPRLMITRKKLPDGGKYYGPFTDVEALHSSLDFLRKLFPLRTCRNLPDRPCLEYHMKRCLAPCAEKVSKEEYRSLIKDVCMFLDGKSKELDKDLEKRMLKAAEVLDFELAARLRDQLNAVRKVRENVRVSMQDVKREMEYQLAELVPPDAKTIGAVNELGKYLGLKNPPVLMECFDISHNQGQETVASMVVFENGMPKKSAYRRFKIKSTEGKPDDFLSMREVTTRRYGKKDIDLPDLIVIDGGKGQLSSALEIIRGAGHIDVPVVGLAKREEEIFCEGESEPVILPRDSQALYLIQRIRDEAHRFAITFHRSLRRKRNMVSILDNIEGIGPKRRNILLEHYSSIDKIKVAEVEEMASLKGMSRNSAEAVYNFFHAKDMM